MITRRHILGSAFASVLPALAFGQAPSPEPEPAAAPLGLKWGASKNEVTALGVNLSGSHTGQWGVGTAARNLPVSLQDAETVYLYFGFTNKLWRIAIVSRQFPNDHTGTLVRNRFFQLQALLTERYGQPAPFSLEPTESFFTAPEQWSYSIAQNRRKFGASWVTPA